MIPHEILRQIKKIEIRTTSIVESIFGGQYQSVFKGRGMEFAEVREYTPGDDIRTIDWNVTARTGTPYVKLFHEEREMSVFFVVDLSSSLQFGTGEKLKSEIAAEICAVLAFSAMQNNDKIGLMLFSDMVEKYIPLKKGKRHVLRIIRDILYYQPQNKKTHLRYAIESLNKILNHKAVIFLVSDFYDTEYEKPLKILAHKHDVIAINVYDPFERNLPDVGLINLMDSETGSECFLDTSNKKIRDVYSTEAESAVKKLNSFFLSNSIDKIDIDVTCSYVKSLRSFFEVRAKRL